LVEASRFIARVPCFDDASGRSLVVAARL
jgi:hypothetical protein